MSQKNGQQDTVITLGDGVVQWQKENLEYKRYEYDLKSDSIVFDIGAYNGEFSEKIKKKYGCVPKQFEATSDTAAWLHDGEIDLGGSNNTRSAFNHIGIKKFKCVDIVRIIKEYSNIDLLKINIEGGEYALLSYIIQEKVISTIDNIQVQFHCVSSFDYKLLYYVITKQLAETHVIDWRYAFCWESWKRKK